MNQTNRLWRLIGLWLLGAALMACGGGGDSHVAQPPPQPDPQPQPQPGGQPELVLVAGSVASSDALACGYVDAADRKDARFSSITSLVALDDGRILVAEDGTGDIVPCFVPLSQSRIRAIGPNGEVSTWALGDRHAGRQRDNSDLPPLRSFLTPVSLAQAPDGAVWVSDTYCHNCVDLGNRDLIPTHQGMGIWAVDARHNVSIVAGVRTSGSSDGQGLAAQFFKPGAIVIDSQGMGYVLDAGKIRQIDEQGHVKTLPFGARSYVGLVLTSNRRLVVADDRGDIVDFHSGELWASGVGVVEDMAVDSKDNLYFTTQNQPTVIYRLVKGQAPSEFLGREIHAGVLNDWGTLPRPLLRVEALAVDKNDRLLVASGYAILAAQLTP